MFRHSLIITVVLFALTFAIEPKIGSSQRPYLEDGKIIPYSGTSRTSYIAEVFYYDPDGDPPAKVEVVIDKVSYPLRLIKGRTTNGGFGGKFRSNRLTLPPGEHYYYFYSEDGKGRAARFPRYGEKLGPLTGFRKPLNRMPRLSQGGVFFSQGSTTDLYNFTVNYFDPDCRPPKAVIAFIDGIACTMKLFKGKPSDGIYLTQRVLKKGSHAYYFYAIDEGGERVSLPEEGFIRGPEVFESFNEPPKLFDGKIDPIIGYQNATYTYYITYRDEDRDPPAEITVVINGYPHKMNLLRGEKYDGVYYFSSNLYPGNYHNYYFYCEDGRGGVKRIPEVGSYHGPVVLK